MYRAYDSLHLKGLKRYNNPRMLWHIATITLQYDPRGPIWTTTDPKNEASNAPIPFFLQGGALIHHKTATMLHLSECDHGRRDYEGPAAQK